MKKLWKYMRDYRREGILAPLFKLLEASLELLVPLVMAQIIDIGIANGDGGFILSRCGILAVLAAVGLVCSITAQYFAAKASVGFAAKLRSTLFKHIQSLSYSKLDTQGTGTLIARITGDINQVQSGMNLALRLLLRSPFVVFGAMIMCRLCIVWQGIDWLREKKLAKGIAAIAAVLCWPYVVVVFLLLFPQVQEMPIASTVVAFVITSPLPMWTAITDGSWSFLLGGVLLYALRGRRKVQLTVWALVIFLCDFALTFGMACRQEGFVWTQMFTDNYEWFGVAAVLLMLLYNGQRGSGHKQLFYWFYPAHVYLLYGASCLLYNVLR